MTLLLLYAGIALGFSFFCSLAEAILLSMTPYYVQNRVRQEQRAAVTLHYLSTHLDQALAAILSLNTIAHTVGAVGVGAQAAHVFGSSHVGLASAVLTFFILVLSEIIPKTVGATYWRSMAPLLARPIWLLVKSLWPLVLLSEQLTKLIARGRPLGSFRREELAAMAEVGAEEGQLLPKELRVVKNLVRFRAILTRDVMTPRIVLFALPEQLTVKEAMAEKPQIPFSRIPLHGESQDEITGVMLKTDLYLASARDQHDTQLTAYRRPLVAVPDSLPLMALFEKLLDERQHIALVMDDYGSVAGLVTLEDVIETLIGFEIVDEQDTTPDMQELARRLWRERAAKLGIVVPEEAPSEAPTATAPEKP